MQWLLRAHATIMCLQLQAALPSALHLCYRRKLPGAAWHDRWYRCPCSNSSCHLQAFVGPNRPCGSLLAGKACWVPDSMCSCSSSDAHSSVRLPCVPPTGWRPAQVAVQVQGHLNAAEGSQGWTVEMALPWSLLQQAANRQVPPAHGEAACCGAIRGAV
jgi:hypothetical protein